MGIVHWTPFCTALGITHLIVFGLQVQNFIPWNWTAHAYPSEGALWHQWLSSLVLHINWTHLTNNAFCLFAFGTALEHRIGTLKTVIIYILSGIGGNFLFGVFESGSSAVGASGCLFGVICSLAFVHPRSLVITPGAPLPVPILIFAPLYIFNEIVALPESGSKIAHIAHIGGGVSGAIVGKLMMMTTKPKSTPEP